MRAPNHETHQLRYATWDERFRVEKPYTIVSDMPWLEGNLKTNLKFAMAPEEVITDVRGHENEFNLDDNGFAYLSYKFPSIDMFNEAAVKEILYPKAEEFLKTRVAGVDRVYFFDHRLRSNDTTSLSNMTEIPNTSVPLPPARGVHIDQSPGGALRRVRAWMGDETDYLLRGRVRIINLWFPYDYPIKDCPLAVCDGSTIRAEDMLVADHVTRTYIGETVFPLYNKDAKWFYLSGQKPDEVLVFKIFDSDNKVKAKGVPHTAFEVHNRDKEWKPRKSFEIRGLVFTYPEA